jgi:sigma-B regulation protein RsbU (phosphoserine phosphatase)
MPRENDKTALVAEDSENFFQHPLCGFISTDAEGIIQNCNNTFLKWLTVSKEEVLGTRFSDLLSIGSKIYYETHLWPLLRMQGFFDEVAVDLQTKSGEKEQVLLNAYEQNIHDALPEFIRFTVFRARDRRIYEQNLKIAKNDAEIRLTSALDLVQLREQIIAILGHDLRNPLGAIKGATEMLSQSQATETNKRLVALISKSATRMSELIETIMDFARTKLGGGLVLNQEDIVLEPVLQQVIEELQTSFPEKVIYTHFNNKQRVHCDSYRVAQVFSNLLANAITHGAPDKPINVTTDCRDGMFEMSVTNEGSPIPVEIQQSIFEPFTRESTRPSQNGLGLGLYIASQIAQAHGGQLTCTSDEKETRFTLTLKCLK